MLNFFLKVGLAVGDIDTVRKQAAIRLIAQVVDWHDRIETAIPRTLYQLLVVTVWKSKSSKDSPHVVSFIILKIALLLRVILRSKFLLTVYRKI